MEPAPEPAMTLRPQPDPSASELGFKDPERRQLVGRILKAYEDEGYHNTLSPVGFAVVWLANIDCLRSLVESLETDFTDYSPFINPSRDTEICAISPNLGIKFSASFGASNSAAETPKIRQSSGNTCPPTDMSDNPIQTERSEKIVEMCHERDKECVVTKSTNPTVSAHVVPYSFTNLGHNATNDFWLFLKIFWGEDQAKRWREYSINTKTTDSVENHILLSPSAHAYWDEWLFALEPVLVSTDKRKLFVRFHWLCPGNLESLVLQMTTQALDDPDFVLSPPSFRPAMDLSRGGRDKSDTSTPPNLRLLDCESCDVVKSGDVITITTDDPESLPLPSFEILHLQWILHRVRALAAAAGFDDEFVDDGDYGLGEEPCVAYDEDILSECECVGYY